jgi:hypothetical protein
MMNLFSIFGNLTFISIGFVILHSLLNNYPQYNIKGVIVNDAYQTEGEVETVFYWACYIFTIFSVLAIVISFPFKQKFFNNLPLTVFCVGMIIYNALTILFPSIHWMALGYDYDVIYH